MPTEYRLIYSDEAAKQLRELDGSVRGPIAKKARSLQKTPNQFGKELHGRLAGYRSVHAAGRYRIVYQAIDGVEEELDKDGDPRWLGRLDVACLGARRAGDADDVYVVADRILGT
jgi:mRNA-degrading endonuclease RelE of RelBE toxin-antitoxin system